MKTLLMLSLLSLPGVSNFDLGSATDGVCASGGKGGHKDGGKKKDEEDEEDNRVAIEDPILLSALS